MQELYREYSQLIKATQQLSPSQKQEVVGLTMKPEWKSFIFMLDDWKNNISTLCMKTGKDKDDLLTAQAQIRNIAVLKTFQNKYKRDHTPTINDLVDTTDDSITVPLSY